MSLKPSGTKADSKSAADDDREATTGIAIEIDVTKSISSLVNPVGSQEVASEPEQNSITASDKAVEIDGTTLYWSNLKKNGPRPYNSKRITVQSYFPEEDAERYSETFQELSANQTDTQVNDTMSLPSQAPISRSSSVVPAINTMPAILQSGSLTPISAQGANHEGALMTSSPEFLTGEEFADRINFLWKDVVRSFLEIGNLLRTARKNLEHGQFTKLIQEQVPFSHSIANKLMKASKFIDDNPVIISQLPVSYSTIYEVATLSKAQLEKARAENILRPNVTRKEIIDLKKSVKIRQKQYASRKHELDDKIERLRQRIDDLTTELEVLVTERAAFD